MVVGIGHGYQVVVAIVAKLGDASQWVGALYQVTECVVLHGVAVAISVGAGNQLATLVVVTAVGVGGLCCGIGGWVCDIGSVLGAGETMAIIVIKFARHIGKADL